jgi:hemerythrin-like domain-containing protein
MIVQSIRDEHERLAERLSLLKMEVEKAASGAPDVLLLDLLAQFFSSFPDKVHHAKEHRLYYALIRQGVPEDAYLRRLKEEHKRLGAKSERFAADLKRLLLRGGVPSAFLLKRIRAFIEMQEVHMADEESQFLPLLSRHLSPARLLEIEREQAAEENSEEQRGWERRIAILERSIDERLKSV